MEFRLLGPLVVRDSEGGPRIVIGRARERKLLAVLLIHANKPLSRDRLIQLLWENEAPASKTRALQQAVHRLREALEAPSAATGRPNADGAPSRVGPSAARRLQTTGGGYMLAVGPDELDTVVFERRVDDALRSDAGPAARCAALQEALDLWRGDALADFSYDGFAADEIRRLEELRLVALEERIAADLELGRHGPLVAELSALVASNQLRERLWALLMLALYRSARQGEALRAYQSIRKILQDTLGVLPGKELRDLEEAILQQDPALDLKVASGDEDPSNKSKHNLWRAPTNLIGRDDHLSQVMARLETSRLVTLTGPTGVGKTRLGLAAAFASLDKFSDGVWCVSVEESGNEEDLLRAVAETLGLGDGEDSISEDGRIRVIIDGLRRRELLLWFDGCDALVGTVRALAQQILPTSPSVRMLATSQERLGLSGEAHYPVPPLRVDEHGPAGLPTGSAVDLLTARARVVDSSFVVDAESGAVVARLLRDLDGLPLAIELAASMLQTRTPREIAAQIGKMDRNLPTELGGQDRRPSLDAALQASFARLSEDDQLMLLAVSVFEGSWTISQAEALNDGFRAEHAGVAPGPEAVATVLRLVDRSLVMPMSGLTDDSAQFSVLHTVKRFLRARLAGSGQLSSVRRLHASYFADFLARRQSSFMGSAGVTTLAELERARRDLYSALDFFVEFDGERAVALAADLAVFWLRTGRAGDGYRRLQRALAAGPQSGLNVARGCLIGAGLTVLDRPSPLGNVRFGHPLMAPRYRGKERGPSRSSEETDNALTDRARGIFDAIGHKTGGAITGIVEAMAAGVAGRHEESIAAAEEAMSALDDLGRTWWRSAAALVLADGLLSRSPNSHGEQAAADALQQAEELAIRALGFFIARGDAFMTIGALETLARIASAADRHLMAADLLRQAIEEASYAGDRPGTANLMIELGVAHLRAGDLETAQQSLAAALGLSRMLGYDYGIGMARCFQGVALGQQGDLETSLEMFKEAVAIFAGLGAPDRQAFALTLLGYVETWLGAQAKGEEHLLVALDLLSGQADPAIVAGILEGLGHAELASGDWLRAAQLLSAADAHLDSARMTRVDQAAGRVNAAYEILAREMGETSLEEARRRGRDMDTESAIRLARRSSGG